MVERVREAIRLKLHGIEKDVRVHEMTDAELEGVARAAIEAMQEPTEAMLDVGEWSGGENGIGRGSAHAAWSVMIDAALTTSPST
jgi:hypothetical protein